jgi:hypothetical protein
MVYEMINQEGRTNVMSSVPAAVVQKKMHIGGEERYAEVKSLATVGYLKDRALAISTRRGFFPDSNYKDGDHQLRVADEGEPDVIIYPLFPQTYQLVVKPVENRWGNPLIVKKFRRVTDDQEHWVSHVETSFSAWPDSDSVRHLGATPEEIEARLEEETNKNIIPAFLMPPLTNFIVDITAEMADSVSRNYTGDAVHLNCSLVGHKKKSGTYKITGTWTPRQSMQSDNEPTSANDATGKHAFDFDVRIDIESIQNIAGDPADLNPRRVPHITITVFLGLFARENVERGDPLFVEDKHPESNAYYRRYRTQVWPNDTAQIQSMSKSGFDVVFGTHVDRERPDFPYNRYARRFKDVARHILKHLYVADLGYHSVHESDGYGPIVSFQIRQTKLGKPLRHMRNESQFSIATIGYTYIIQHQRPESDGSRRYKDKVQSMSTLSRDFRNNMVFQNVYGETGKSFKDSDQVFKSEITKRYLGFGGILTQSQMVEAVMDTSTGLFNIYMFPAFRRLMDLRMITDVDIIKGHGVKGYNIAEARKAVTIAAVLLYSAVRTLTGRYPLAMPYIFMYEEIKSIADETKPRIRFLQLLGSVERDGQEELSSDAIKMGMEVVQTESGEKDTFPKYMIIQDPSRFLRRVTDEAAAMPGNRSAEAGDYVIDFKGILFARNSKGAEIRGLLHLDDGIMPRSFELGEPNRKIIGVGWSMLTAPPGLMKYPVRMSIFRALESAEYAEKIFRNFDMVSRKWHRRRIIEDVEFNKIRVEQGFKVQVVPADPRTGRWAKLDTKSPMAIFTKEARLAGSCFGRGEPAPWKPAKGCHGKRIQLNKYHGKE